MKKFKLNSKEFENRMRSYIFDCIDFSEREKSPGTDEEKLRELFNTFMGEKVNNYELMGYRGDLKAMFKDWLMGLPTVFNVDFENYKILKLAENYFETMDTNASEQTKNRIIDCWFTLVTEHTFKLFEENKINIKEKKK